MFYYGTSAQRADKVPILNIQGSRQLFPIDLTLAFSEEPSSMCVIFRHSSLSCAPGSL
jgi:hypothetical protein